MGPKTAGAGLCWSIPRVTFLFDSPRSTSNELDELQSDCNEHVSFVEDCTTNTDKHNVRAFYAEQRTFSFFLLRTMV